MDNSFDLPPLPRFIPPEDGWDNSTRVYTADQMQAYARAAVEAEREACAKLCDGIYTNGDMAECWTQYAAELIRARGKS